MVRPVRWPGPRPKSHQVSGKGVDLILGKSSVRLDSVRHERLWVPEPSFDPGGREPTPGIIQVGSNVSTRASDGMTRLALIFYVVELPAERGHSRRKCLCIGIGGIDRGMLQSQSHVVGEGCRVLIAQV